MGLPFIASISRIILNLWILVWFLSLKLNLQNMLHSIRINFTFPFDLLQTRLSV